MTRIMRSPPVDADWRVVSEDDPCPICGSTQGPCSGNDEESFVSCAHNPSDWLLTNGAWLHPVPLAELQEAPIGLMAAGSAA